MGRKRANKFQEEQRRKKRNDQDAQLSVGLANLANSAEDDFQETEDNTQDWDNEEQDYELKPRSLNQDSAEFESLPIKRGGVIERVMKKVERKQQPEDEESEQEETQDENVQEEEEEFQESENEVVEEEDTEAKIIALKEEIADLVEQLTEDPEGNINCLTRLIKMAQSKNPNTARFSLLAIVPALKMIVPGYSIRPLTELEKKEKVTKDVQKLRHFEQTLVLNYRAYIDLLAEYLKHSLKNPAMGQFAIKAACELASSFRLFNFRPDVLILVIRRICKPSTKNDPLFNTAVKTLETLLDDDDTGEVSYDVVRLLCKTLKSRKFKVDESVLNILLSLNILNDYDPNSDEDDNEKVKIKKKDRVHISKKERKQRKERREIEEELRKAEQKVSEEERERFQSEILKMILKLYLEILREQNTGLLAAVLEGLAKIGHLVNYELLGDFLTVFKEIISNVELSELDENSSLSRQVLLSIATSFALVSNHAQFKVQVDLSSFIDSLYGILFNLSLDADIEFSHKTLRLADPLNNKLVKPSVNVSTKIELLLKSLENIFFKSKNGSKLRSLAFTKKLSIILLQCPEKSSIALLKFIEKLFGRYSELASLFSTEDRILNGKFDLLANDINKSNPQAATIYELFLLEKHYSPIVAKGAKSLNNQAREQLK